MCSTTQEPCEALSFPFAAVWPPDQDVDGGNVKDFGHAGALGSVVFEFAAVSPSIRTGSNVKEFDPAGALRSVVIWFNRLSP